MRTLLAGLIWAAAAGGAFAAAPSPADDAPFVSGRPGKNESPIVVPGGKLQIETELVRIGQDRADGVKTRTLSVAATSLRFGLGGGYEAEAIVQPHLREKAAGEAGHEGVGDLDVRMRKSLAGGEGKAVAAALIPYVRLPTSQDGLGNRRLGGGVLLPVQAQLDDKWGVSATLGAAVDDSAKPGRRVTSGSLALGAGYALTEKLGGFAELYAARPFEGGAKTESTFDVGLTWLAGAHLQLDLGVNLGLSDAAADAELYTGIARRF